MKVLKTQTLTLTIRLDLCAIETPDGTPGVTRNVSVDFPPDDLYCGYMLDQAREIIRAKLRAMAPQGSPLVMPGTGVYL